MEKKSLEEVKELMLKAYKSDSNKNHPDDMGSDFQVLPSDHTKVAFSIASDNHGKSATEEDIQRKLKELGSPEYDSDKDIEFGD